MTLVLHDPSFLFLGKSGFFLFLQPNASKSRFQDSSGILPRTVSTSLVPLGTESTFALLLSFSYRDHVLSGGFRGRPYSSMALRECKSGSALPF